MTTDTRVVSCPSCGVKVAAGERFCEACGSDLPGAAAADEPESAVPAAPRACRECGGEVADDGYCLTCGALAPRERDHYTEQPAGWVAAVSDRGVRHHRNEDASAVAADADPGSHAVLVICDGVSSSLDSDVASLAAARAARDALDDGRGHGAGTPASWDAALAGRLAAAADAANEAVLASTEQAHGDNPPSCTFVAAVVEQGRLAVGVVGDSRAYWVPDDGEALLLTVDDSWAAEQIAAGVLREQAESAPQAHAITRWLGVDAPDHAPRTTVRTLDRAGWVLLCSDGLWNYCSAPADLAGLVRRTAASDPQPLGLAAALVDWAVAQGGHDNITVALARVDPVSRPEPDVPRKGTSDG